MYNHTTLTCVLTTAGLHTQTAPQAERHARTCVREDQVLSVSEHYFHCKICPKRCICSVAAAAASGDIDTAAGKTPKALPSSTVPSGATTAAVCRRELTRGVCLLAERCRLPVAVCVCVQSAGASLTPPASLPPTSSPFLVFFPAINCCGRHNVHTHHHTRHTPP